MDILAIINALAPIIVATIPILASVFTTRSKTKKQIIELSDKLGGHIREDEDYKAKQARTRILRFADECYRGELHSENFFEDIIEDIDYYEQFCSAHKDFRNNKAKSAIKRIKEVYEKCQREHSFLT